MTKTHETFTQQMSAINPKIQILGEYFRDNIHIPCKCLTCFHVWSASPSNLLRKRGCPNCRTLKFVATNRLDRTQAEERILKNFSTIKLLENFSESKKRIKCLCLVCNHVITPVANNLLHGKQGACKYCKNAKVGGKNKHTHTEFLDLLKIKNKNDLTINSVYSGRRSLCAVICNVCHYSYTTSAGSLLVGSGCPKCKKRAAVTQDEFFSRVPHDSNVTVLSAYIDSHTKVLVKCTKCAHEWRILPHNLYKGRSCAKCAKYGLKTDQKTYFYFYPRFAKFNLFGYGVTNDFSQRIIRHKANLGKAKIEHGQPIAFSFSDASIPLALEAFLKSISTVPFDILNVEGFKTEVCQMEAFEPVFALVRILSKLDAKNLFLHSQPQT